MFTVSQDDDYVDHIGKIFFKKAIKIDPDKNYAIGKIILKICILCKIALKPSAPCFSYYGANGKFETQEFSFEDAEFSNEYSDNSTNTN